MLTMLASALWVWSESLSMDGSTMMTFVSKVKIKDFVSKLEKSPFHQTFMLSHSSRMKLINLDPCLDEQRKKSVHPHTCRYAHKPFNGLLIMNRISGEVQPNLGQQVSPRVFLLQVWWSKESTLAKLNLFTRSFLASLLAKAPPPLYRHIHCNLITTWLFIAWIRL